MEPIINLIWQTEDDNEKKITPLAMQKACILGSCAPEGGGPTPYTINGKTC